MPTQTCIDTRNEPAVAWPRRTLAPALVAPPGRVPAGGEGAV